MSTEHVQGEIQTPCDDRLSVKDWLDFLEKRRTACITFIISTFVMTAVLLGTILISMARGEITGYWIIVASIGFGILVGCYIIGVNLWGSPRKQATACSAMIFKILSGELKDVSNIQFEWKKYETDFKPRSMK